MEGQESTILQGKQTLCVAKLPDKADEEERARDALAASVATVAEDRNSHGALFEVSRQSEALHALFRLAAGDSNTSVAEDLGVSRKTLSALKERHSENYKLFKVQAARNLAATADMATKVTAMKLRQLHDDPEQLAKANFKDITIGMGVVIDKSNGANGEAAAVIEHRHTVSIEDYQETIRAAKAKVIDLEPSPCQESISTDNQPLTSNPSE